jgi:hypothetical protein
VAKEEEMLFVKEGRVFEIGPRQTITPTTTTAITFTPPLPTPESRTVIAPFDVLASGFATILEETIAHRIVSSSPWTSTPLGNTVLSNPGAKVGIGTGSPLFKLDVQQGSARFSRTRIMPLGPLVTASSSVSQASLTLSIADPSKPSRIYAELRATLYSAGTKFSGGANDVRAAFRMSGQGGGAILEVTMGDVSIIRSSAGGGTLDNVAISPSASSSSATLVFTTLLPTDGRFVIEGDLLLVEHDNALDERQTTVTWIG